MLNLKVGDILEREGKTVRVVGVCGEVVFIKEHQYFSPEFYHLDKIEELGWQLKKTEGINMCHCYPLCKDCTKKKTEENNKSKYNDFENGDYTMHVEFSRLVDKWCLVKETYFQTKEQAEAYRSELIERNK